MPLSQLQFDNQFVKQLPADSETRNFVRNVSNACYSRVQPATVSAPKLVAYSPAMAEALGLSAADCQSPEFAQVFAGNRQLEGMDAFAMCYGGHQFGNWAGQLGDGRAINLGELVTNKQRWMLQLKGAGMTPYSRHADGLAVLRSSAREFLCSEAMYHLGIPTTRALSLVLTGEQVQRDMFYDGNPEWEPGAVVCRVAPSFVRFGSFEIFAARDDKATLKQLADFTIANDFPELNLQSPTVYIEWFERVCQLTLKMVVHWARVGFVHGVMNTDNMSILGLTIDYGPYGWLDVYDPEWTPNTTDLPGRRYCFGQQPQITQWNLYKLAQAIYPLIGAAEPLEKILNDYGDQYEKQFRRMMADKLGLQNFLDSDQRLFDDLDAILTEQEVDMTIFYRVLADVTENSDSHHFDPAFYSDEVPQGYRQKLNRWLTDYLTRLSQQELSAQERRQRMNDVNPKYVLRNYLAQQAIDKATEGDYELLNILQKVLTRPYDEQPEFSELAAKRPEWARQKAGCSMLSCSS